MKRAVLSSLLVLALFFTMIPFPATIADQAQEAAPIRYVVPGNPQTDDEYIEGVVSDAMQADGVNLKLDIIRIPWDVWDQKSLLMISSGEEFELLHVMQDLKTLGTLYGQGAIVSLSDYLKSGKFDDLLGKFSDAVWREVTTNGQVLAIPTTSTSNDGKLYGDVYYRSDIAEAAGLKTPTTVDECVDFSIAMQKYIQEEYGVTAYCAGQRHQANEWIIRTFPEFFYVDNTGLIRINQDGSVQSWIETEEFKYCCDVFHKLYEAGQINPDILTDSWGGSEDYWTLAFDCREKYLLPNVQINCPEADVGCIRLNDEKGDFIHFFSWNCDAVPSTCKNPEAGIQFKQWLYADKENHDLLLYGVEGVTYTADNDYTYTAIKDASGNPLYNFGDWMVAYRPYRRHAANIPTDIAQFSVRDREVSDWPVTLSPYIGFQFDSSTIADVMANIDAVYELALNPLVYGVVSYDEGYNEALATLKTAGLDTFVQEYSRQFADYYAQQKG